VHQALTSPVNKGAVNTLLAWLHGNGTTPSAHALILHNIVPAATTRAELKTTAQEIQIKPSGLQNCFVSSYTAQKVIDHIDTSVSLLRAAAKI
jgi:hypothetical protein